MRDRFRYEGNPSNIMEGTFTRRDVALSKLKEVSLELVTQPRLGERSVQVRVKGEVEEYDAFKNWEGDPYFVFSKAFDVPVGGNQCLISGAPFFSMNEKMASMSFGTPAGPDSVKGSCPASALPDEYQKHYALGDVDQRPMKYDEQICRKCYANKGNMTYELQQLYQVVRYRWIEECLASGMSTEELGGIFLEAVTTASRNAKKRIRDGESTIFVRLHDSGDLFDVRYWKAWKFAIERTPHLVWWCPTRMWMIPSYTKLFQEGVPRNLALRPSAYHFNEKAPVIPRVGAGSTSHYWEKKKGGIKVDPILSGIADWKCPAYEEVEGVKGTSCSGALERVDKVWVAHNRAALEELKSSMTPKEMELTNNCKDCRVCWLRKDMRVSYQAH